MNNLFILLCFMVFLPAAIANNDASRLRDVGPDTREYLNSVQNALLGETTYRSYDNTEILTSAFTAPTTYYLPVEFVDADNNIARWLTQSISTFSVATSALTTTVAFSASITTGTLNFVGGSASAVITVTGTPNHGSYVTLTMPAVSSGVISAVTATRILTFGTSF